MDEVQQIKEKLDIVELIKEYIQLLPAGQNFKAVCPFHKEKTPSFMVSPSRQTWRCFGQCNEGGDIFSFIMKYEGVEFYEALKMLAEKAGVELRSVSPASQKEFGVLYDITDAAREFFIQQLQSNDEAKEYLSQRKLHPDTQETFGIGFAPSSMDALTLHLVNAGYSMEDVERAGLAFKTQRGTYMDRFRGRIIFPLYNTFGKTVGFAGRILPTLDDEKTAKYINTPETPIYNKSHILYGYHITKGAIKDEHEAVLVEGNMDVIMLHQDGVENAVAISGTALTEHHLEVLSRNADSLLLFFDNDQAGQAAADRAIDMASEHDFDVRIVVLQEGKDAADVVAAHPGSMKATIKEKAVSAFEFYRRRYLDDMDESNTKSRIRSMLEKVVALKSPVERSRWIQKIADATTLREKVLLDEMELLSTPKKRISNEDKPSQRPEDTLASRAEKLAFKVLVLVVAAPDEVDQLREYTTYFPERFATVADAVITGNKSNASVESAVEYLEMKASVDPPDSEHIASEISFLLAQLKQEYLKSERDALRAQIQALEQKGDKEQMPALLKKFDELTKLMNT
jgi:DNA primase